MMEAALAFLFGLLMGSFLNVCIYRMPRELPVVRPRSYCPSCDKTIAWYDNIPVLSYFLLGRACRWCQAGIPYRYPLVELLTGSCFAAAVAGQGVTTAALKQAVFSALLIGLTFTDLEERILPDEFTLGGMLMGLGLAAAAPAENGLMAMLLPASWNGRVVSMAEAAFAGLLTGGAMLLVRQVYYWIRKRHGMGDADPLMVGMIGTFLGIQLTLVTLIVGSLLGSIAGLLYVWLARKDAATYELPFGTFLGVAGLAVTWFGRPVLRWWVAG